MALGIGRVGLRHLSRVHVVRHTKGLTMGFAGGLIAIALAIGLIFALKAKGLEERAFARNWMALVGVTMGIMLLFIGGVAGVISNWP